MCHDGLNKILYSNAFRECQSEQAQTQAAWSSLYQGVHGYPISKLWDEANRFLSRDALVNASVMADISAQGPPERAQLLFADNYQCTNTFIAEQSLSSPEDTIASWGRGDYHWELFWSIPPTPPPSILSMEAQSNSASSFHSFVGSFAEGSRFILFVSVLSSARELIGCLRFLLLLCRLLDSDLELALLVWGSDIWSVF
jgi:hypothetical protein